MCRQAARRSVGMRNEPHLHDDDVQDHDTWYLKNGDTRDIIVTTYLGYSLSLKRSSDIFRILQSDSVIFMSCCCGRCCFLFDLREYHEASNIHHFDHLGNICNYVKN